jgi:hypothetical protein
MVAVQEQWRKHGVLGKLHNIVQYIYSSSQRRDAWLDVTVGQNYIDGKYIRSLSSDDADTFI